LQLYAETLAWDCFTRDIAFKQDDRINVYYFDPFVQGLKNAMTYFRSYELDKTVDDLAFSNDEIFYIYENAIFNLEGFVMNTTQKKLDPYFVESLQKESNHWMIVFLLLVFSGLLFICYKCLPRK
jgi:hypothetical protein